MVLRLGYNWILGLVIVIFGGFYMWGLGIGGGSLRADITDNTGMGAVVKTWEGAWLGNERGVFEGTFGVDLLRRRRTEIRGIWGRYEFIDQMDYVSLGGDEYEVSFYASDGTDRLRKHKWWVRFDSVKGRVVDVNFDLYSA